VSALCLSCFLPRDPIPDPLRRKTKATFLMADHDPNHPAPTGSEPPPTSSSAAAATGCGSRVLGGIETNVETLNQLMRMMSEFEVTALDLVENGREIRLRRQKQTVAAAMPTPAAVVAPAPTSPVAPPVASAPEPAPLSKPTLLTIESPTVGTFYVAPSPESPPFVQVGSIVHEKTIVGIIEAMKVFTEIPAGVSGRIVEVLVKNKQPVEFGQVLFRVEPS